MPFVNTLETAPMWATATTTLSSAVNNGGTVTIAYPAGTNQAFFTGNRATTLNQAVVLDKNNSFGSAQASVVYGASNITITNSTGQTWPVGAVLDVQLGYWNVSGGMSPTLFSAFTGAAAAGACTLAGAVVGQRVLGVVQTNGTVASSSFEGVITVAGQIQQTSASNLSANTYLVILGVDEA